MFQIKVVEKIKIHFLCSITSSPPENRVIYEVMWKHFVEPAMAQTKIWRMRFACWIPKATDSQLTACSSYWVFAATVVTQMHLGVSLHIRCPSCWYRFIYSFRRQFLAEFIWTFASIFRFLWNCNFWILWGLYEDYRAYDFFFRKHIWRAYLNIFL